MDATRGSDADGATPDDALVPLRTTRRRALADDWCLVLAAEGLVPELRGGRDGFTVFVPHVEVRRAVAALASFERENQRVAAPPEPAPVDRHPVRHALVVASALLASFPATGPAFGASRVAAAGEAEAAAIRAGAWWRAITALTLHADAAHVLGNAVAGAVFLAAVFRVFGPGVGGALVLASGALGNAANAFVRDPAHATVGASTAVFGALGLAAGHAVATRRSALRGRPVWLPIGAALALLAMIGTAGERTDVWAHVLGLAAGVALGVIATRLPAAWLARREIQIGAALAALGTLALAWSIALERA